MKVRLKLFTYLLILILPISSILAGCTPDSKEIDDQVYTLVIGCDKGVENKIRMTVQFPTYKGGGGSMEKQGGGEDGDKETGKVSGTIVSTIESSSILEGLNLLNTSTSRRISLVHTKAIIISEDLAREGIARFLEPISRFREARRIMQVIVCRGTAQDFIKENKTNVGESVAKAIELMGNQADNTGFFPRAPFQNFYKAVVSPYEQPFCVYAGINDFKNLRPLEEARSPLRPQYEVQPGDLPRTGDLKREFIGTAVFDGDKMVGFLNSYETRYFLMVMGQYRKGIITVADLQSADKAIPFDIRLGRKPKVIARMENGIPIINVSLNIEADLGGIQSRYPYEKLDKIDELNIQIEKTIREGVQKTIEKTQKEWGIDVFGFGRKIAHHFITIQEFEEYNWLAQYEKAKINVEVEANVRRTGLMYEASPIRYKDGKASTKNER